ncbi:MAG: catalase-related domain-containing protein, partial [Providencia sp.]
LSIEGAADHWDHREDQDYFSQPRALYELLDDAEHQRMFQRIAGELIDATETTQVRQIALFKQVHPEYGAGVEKALNALK